MTKSNIHTLFPSSDENQLPTQEEIREEINRQRGKMMADAIGASRYAYSYREVPVRIGCVVLGCKCGRDGERFKTFWGANFTWSKMPRPKPPERIRYCAERNAIQKAVAEGYKIADLTIYTEHNQPDDLTGLTTALFAPCWECCECGEPHSLPETQVTSFRLRRPDDHNSVLPGISPVFVVQQWQMNVLIDLHKAAAGWHLR